MAPPYRVRARPLPSTTKESGKGEKDLFDKVATLTVPFVTLVLGLLGAYATWSGNAKSLEQQRIQATADRLLRRDQANAAQRLADTQALERLLAYLSSRDPQKRLFGYEMFVAMKQEELAIKLIWAKGDKAAIPLLRRLQDNPNWAVRQAAGESLASFARLENATSAGSGSSAIILHQRSSCRDFAAAGFRISHSPMMASDVVDAARKLDVEPAALQAFLEVEGTSASLADGRPRILFERSIFHRLTRGQYDGKYPGISSGTAGGYKGGTAEYDRLTKAAALNCPAALAATSWGMFQLTGQNARAAGYDHVDDYVKDVMSSSRRELAAGITFLRSVRLIEPLRNKDWKTVAHRYNGAGPNANNYAANLAAAYARARNL